MNKPLITLFALLALVSCKEEKRTVERIDFECDYLFNENDDITIATPVDILEVEEKGNITLGLKKGKYQIVITNGKESFKFDQNVK